MEMNQQLLEFCARLWNPVLALDVGSDSLGKTWDSEHISSGDSARYVFSEVDFENHPSLLPASILTC